MNKKQGNKVNLPRKLRPNHNYTVAQEEIKLLDYLITDALKEKSRTTVKQLLHDRFISVNGTATTKFDLELKKGDKVTLHALPLPTELSSCSIVLIRIVRVISLWQRVVSFKKR